MTQQITDPFYWNGERWEFLRASDIYSLFDPEKFGLKPTWFSTACWKGFIITFSLDNDELSISDLTVHTEDKIYPDINNIAGNISGGVCHYNGINIKPNYSGTIIIGQEMTDRYRGRAFIGPHAYSKTYELDIVDGKLVNSRDTSGTYMGF